MRVITRRIQPPMTPRSAVAAFRKAPAPVCLLGAQRPYDQTLCRMKDEELELREELKCRLYQV
jgi:hypothetical protein